MYPKLPAVVPDSSSRRQIFWNLSSATLVEKALQNHECYRTESGGLMMDRAPFPEPGSRQTYFVKDESSAYDIWWDGPGKAISLALYGRVYANMQAHLQTRERYVLDAFACPHPGYRLPFRLITTSAYQCHSCRNMFLCPEGPQLACFHPEYTLLCAPEFEGYPAAIPGKRFILFNLQQKTTLIAGEDHGGEIREAVITLLNYLLPQQHGVLPLSGKVTEGRQGDTAIFLGLPGTGKSTLSADPERNVIGREEHGWDQDGVFAFAGCRFPRVIPVSDAAEAQAGSWMVPTAWSPDARVKELSPRPGVPRRPHLLSFISNAKAPAITGVPRHIFLLTADVYGVLPLVSQLSPAQAMFYFLSGYSAEMPAGGTRPRPVFAAGYGAPGMALPPVRYAELQGRKIRDHQVQVWLLNTGWVGGAAGGRSPIHLMRAIVQAVLANQLEQVPFTRDPLFGLSIPLSCPGVPDAWLNPRLSWPDKVQYEAQAHKLAWLFLRNFDKYKAGAPAGIRSGAPVMHQQMRLC